MPLKRELGGGQYAARPAVATAVSARSIPHPANETPARFEFWRGASGRRYVHSIHSLLLCPAVSEANFILLRREADGTRKVLRVARTTNLEPSLNLAEIRHSGARLGANEVHLHLITTSERERAIVEFDLQAKLAASLVVEPAARH